MSAKIVASPNGEVDEIHVLTTAEYTPKQTVRNIESALIAHLGMRVDHRKISVASSSEPGRPSGGHQAFAQPAYAGAAAGPRHSAPSAAQFEAEHAAHVAASEDEFRELVREVDSTLAGVVPEELSRRRLYFEDVEVRRSRARGVLCRVTLRRGELTFSGEAEGVEGQRSRVDLAARAALKAIQQAENGERTLALDGVKLIEAFDREFVFIGVAAQFGRERALLTGSCEVRESAETAAVLAALDATNRWIAHGR
jgi:hypothetical protein